PHRHRLVLIIEFHLDVAEHRAELRQRAGSTEPKTCQKQTQADRRTPTTHYPRIAILRPPCNFNPAPGAPVSDPARFDVVRAAPGRRPALRRSLKMRSA